MIQYFDVFTTQGGEIEAFCWSILVYETLEQLCSYLGVFSCAKLLRIEAQDVQFHWSVYINFCLLLQEWNCWSENKGSGLDLEEALRIKKD